MPQLQLPIFPVGTTHITSELAFERRENRVVYLNGHLPVFTHEVSDIGSFRLITTQLIVNGTASQSQIAKAFGIPAITIKRCVKKYREQGAKAFFAPTRKRAGKKLTPERLQEVQILLSQGESIPAISAKVSVLQTTLHKAIGSGRLRRPEKKEQSWNQRLSPPRANEA